MDYIMEIAYSAVISFADPSSNFGLTLKTIEDKIKKSKKNDKVVNISDFKKI